MKERLERVYERQKEWFMLEGIWEFLEWDKNTHMPVDAISDRAEQSAYVEKRIHEIKTSKGLYDDVKALSNEKLPQYEAIMIKKLDKMITKAKKLPSSFVHKLGVVKSKAFSAWDEAKKKSDFSIFEPHLKKIVELKQEEIKYIGLEGHPYNSLLDSFEEGMTTERLIILFKQLKEGLIALLKEIKETETYKKGFHIKEQKYPIDTQIEVAKEIVKVIGYPFNKGNLSTVSHPFTITCSPEDVRITNTYRETEPLSSLTGAIHEGGHGIHMLSSPRKYKHTILYITSSFGLHESQSLFWENYIGKSNSFVKNQIWPLFKKYYKDQVKGLDFEQLFRALNLVQPSLIRVDADELTYCLHIIIRFEIEVGLIEGTIQVKDLPEVWNQKMKEALGVVPSNDRLGVLQDVHWSAGDFGYFPSYAIGCIYGAQLFKQIEAEFGDMEKIIEKGNFNKILDWLYLHVHKYGNIFTADEIIKKCTGSGLNIDIYLDYLRRKFLGIYH